MDIRLGYSPCPNDTYIFHGIASGKLKTPGYTVRPELHDVETLNQMAFQEILEASKLSFFAWLKVRAHYRLLASGGALGYGCGPLVIARKPLTLADMNHCRIVLPGQWTTAHMLFRLWAPRAEQRFFVPYDRIFQILQAGEADCGVIIHESRFTFEQAGFYAVQDLGGWWETQTGLPIPLGCIAVHARVGAQGADLLDRLIRQSIALARQNPQAAMPYIRRHAQEMTGEVLQAHIQAFVNEFSSDLGLSGREAVRVLEAKARQAGII